MRRYNAGTNLMRKPNKLHYRNINSTTMEVEDMKVKEFKNLEIEWKRSYGAYFLSDEQKPKAQLEAQKFLKILKKSGIAGKLEVDSFGDPKITFKATIKDICRLSDELGINLEKLTVMSHKCSGEF